MVLGHLLDSPLQGCTKCRHVCPAVPVCCFLQPSRCLETSLAAQVDCHSSFNFSQPGSLSMSELLSVLAQPALICCPCRLHSPATTAAVRAVTPLALQTADLPQVGGGEAEQLPCCVLSRPFCGSSVDGRSAEFNPSDVSVLFWHSKSWSSMSCGDSQQTCPRLEAVLCACVDALVQQHHACLAQQCLMV